MTEQIGYYFNKPYTFTWCFILNFYLFSVKPLINREKLKKITVRASQKVVLEVDVKGEPPPEIWWTLNGKKVSRSGSIIIY